MIHVMPIEDVYDHLITEDCWCHPTETNPQIWVHNAKDCRESAERIKMKKCSAGWEIIKV